MLDDFNVEKWKTRSIVKDKVNANKLMKKTRCKVIIAGKCIPGGEREDIKCKLTLSAAITHTGLDEKSDTLLSNDISSAFTPISDIGIMKCTESEDFEKISLQLKFAFLYVLASTALMCENYADARERFLQLKLELSCEKRNIPAINNLKSIVLNRLQASCLFFASSLYYKFVNSYDFKYLEDLKVFLESSKEYISNTVDYLNSLSICCFLIEREVQKSLDYLNRIQIKPEIIKFNIAFLKLYENDRMTNFLNALRQYNRLDKLSFDKIWEFEKFIKYILDIEPHKAQLSFLLFLIYSDLNNEPLAKQNFRLFNKKYPQLTSDSNFVNAIQKYLRKYDEPKNGKKNLKD
jgi:hypothetical protein